MATYTGDNGDNTYQGGPEADTILGSGGSDTLGGGAGGDTIDGGDGVDYLFSGTISQNWGHSYFYLAPVVPILDHGTEVDTLLGGAGADWIFAGYGDNVDGGADGATLFLSLMGAATGVIADFGNLDGSGMLTIGGGTLTNIGSLSIVEGTDFADHLTGGVYFAPDMFGFGGDDVLVAGGQPNSNLYGGDGNDTLDGRRSNYGGYYYGEAGDDTIYMGVSGNAFGGDGNDVIYGAHYAEGGAGNDTLIVDFYSSAISYLGNDGDDLLVGSGNADMMYGGAGADTLRGGDGSDTLSSGDYVDFSTPWDASFEHDILEGGDGDDFLFIGYGDDVDGGTGRDRLALDFSSATGALTLDFTTFAGSLNVGGGVIQNVELITAFRGGAFDDTIKLSQHLGDAEIYYAFGGGGNDRLEATGGRTELHGEDGNDTLIGSPDDDALYGGAGNDVLDGGAGSNFLDGGAGDDLYRVHSPGSGVADSSGNDTIEASIDFILPNAYSYSEIENLVLVGSAVAGTGNALNNVLTGNALDNILDGQLGADTMIGGGGSDTYLVDNAGDVVVESAGQGFDTIKTTFAVYALSANVEALEFIGGAGQDTSLTGNAGDNQITGGSGNDTIDGGVGVDTMTGGQGNDTFIVDNAGDIIVEIAGGGTDTIRTALTNYTLIAGTFVENLTYTGTAAATLTGNELDNVITGGVGNDALSGGAGNDRLDGGAGVDTLAGGIGDDIYVIDNVGDVISEAASAGSDTVRTTLASFALTANLENLIYTGSANATLTGNSLVNSIIGSSGNDTIDGGAGADTMAGGLGDDIYSVDNAGDIVTEVMGEGTDTVRTTLAAYVLGSALENLEYLGSGSSSLTGNGLNNRITGGTGANTMSGGAGDDTYIVANSADVIIEGSGQGAADTVLLNASASLTLFALAASAEVELLQVVNPAGSLSIDITGSDFAQRIDGNAGTNHLTGGGGNDMLYGFAGDDSLNGGTGADLMVGGVGNDSYQVDETGDTVTELAGEGIDQVTAYIAQYLLPGNVENLTFAAAATLGIGNALDNRMVLLTSGRLEGLDGNDTLIGGTGANTLNGGNGDDLLKGGAGADTLTGGIGADLFEDTASGLNGDTIVDFSVGDKVRISAASAAGFAFSLSGSTLTYSGGSVTLQSLPGGYHLEAAAAVGSGVELVLVQNPTSALSSDFNGDGRDDILWRNDNGQMSNWLGQSSGGFANNDVNAFAQVPGDWKIAGTADFSGDGHFDILWRNGVTGQLSNWLGKDNGGFTTNDANAMTSAPTDWKVVSTGDYNGDGRDDILWRNSANGQLSDWLGQVNGGFTGNDANAFTSAPSEWKVAGTADFNGDGRDDILWRNSATGQLSDWLGQANGGFTSNDANAFATVPTAWQIAGTGDFNGDGRGDILWRNSATGQLSDWLGQANGGFSGNDANAMTGAPLDWQVAGTGDFNGDGRSDIAWRNTTSSAVSDWLGQVNGGFASNDANAYNAGVPLDWKMQIFDTSFA